MRTLALALLLTTAPCVAFAQDAKKADEVYTLGELQVTAQDRNGVDLGGSVITGETLQNYNKQTVEQALALIPGTNASNTGGSRNERIVYVRGFDRFQTTISIDGVRVFLPADNRIDFARFLTADLSEIQVSKGYVSVLDGPGGIGGAINLVTVKPTRRFEAEVQASSFLDRDLNQEGNLFSGRIGGKSGQFYWQASGVVTDRDHFTLSDDFVPTTLENGGAREHSDTHDWRANVKLGWQPNDTDEYSLNYIKSEGEKNAPFSVSDTTNARFWTWPYWNLDSLALLTRTHVGEKLTIKSRLYTNGFDNLLSAFDSAAQSVQTLPRAFNSYYEDTAKGGNIEADYDLSDTNQIKGVFYARQDVHHERQDGFTRTPATGNPSVNSPYHEPWQTNDEWTYSAAGQYSTGLGENFDLTVGASYDWTDLKTANDVSVLVTGSTIATSVISFLPVNYPLKNNSAVNAQAALVWRVNDDIRTHFSVSDRTRFPTVFERFSARMGAAIPNPDVREERSINYEIGADARVSDKVDLSGAVFYSDLTDALILIPVSVPVFGTVNQTKNAADGRYYGAEASLTARVTDSFDLGGNITIIQRDLTDPTNPAFRPQGVPTSKVFVYANWRPIEHLTIRPNVEYASDRWTVTTQTPTAAAPLRFFRTGDYTLFNLSADYALGEHLVFTVAGQNLTDEDYELTYGFPEAGRSFFVSVRARY